MPRIEFNRDALAHFCRANKIAKLALFGSVLRDDFGPDSDVDLLVDFESGARVGIIDISRMGLESSSLFGGRKVDLRTPGDLGRYMRDRVMASAENVYAA